MSEKGFTVHVVFYSETQAVLFLISIYTSLIMLIRFANVCVFSIVQYSQTWFLLDCRRFLGHWRWDGAQRNHSSLLSEAKAGLDRPRKPPPASLTSDLSLTETGRAVMDGLCDGCWLVWDPNKSQNFIIQIQLSVMHYGSFKVHSFFLPPSEVKGERDSNNGLLS